MIVFCFNCNLSLSYFIFIFTLLININLFKSHKNKRCGIDLMKIPKRTLLHQDGESKRMLKENNWDNLRIHMDFSFIENNIGKFDKKDLIDLKEKIMPKTQQIFEGLLKVKRIQNKLKLNTQYCDNYNIPEKYQTEGIDADLVIFVLIDDTGFFLQNKIEAGAIHCLQHQETRRPIAGYIQFKPQLNVNNSTALDYMVWLAVHEVSHILVINNALYEDYINPETLEPIGIGNVVGKKIMENGLRMNYIKSPKVLQIAKKHFNCTNLDGVPLEYNGGAGTAGAHWAKRYMNTDYMIGDSYGENLISDITLALFEDSGWYKVDYNMANLFLWAKGVGCEFFDRKKKCIKPTHSNFKLESDSLSVSIFNENNNNKEKEFLSQNNNNNKNPLKKHIKTYMEIFKPKGYTSDFKNEFCTNFNYPICSTSNIFRGVCKIRKFDFKLSNNERYFRNPNIGGADSLTDKCPIPIEEKGEQSYYGGSCRVGNKETLFMPSIEKICPECACFMSSLNDETKIKVLNQRKDSIIKVEKKDFNENENKEKDSILKNKKEENELLKENKENKENNKDNKDNKNDNSENLLKKNIKKEDQKTLAPEINKDIEKLNKNEGNYF